MNLVTDQVLVVSFSGSTVCTYFITLEIAKGNGKKLGRKWNIFRKKGFWNTKLFTLIIDYIQVAACSLQIRIILSVLFE